MTSRLQRPSAYYPPEYSKRNQQHSPMRPPEYSARQCTDCQSTANEYCKLTSNMKEVMRRLQMIQQQTRMIIRVLLLKSCSCKPALLSFRFLVLGVRRLAFSVQCQFWRSSAKRPISAQSV